MRNDTAHRSGRATMLDRCDGADVEVAIEPIAPGDVNDIVSTLPTRRRGVFELGPLDIQKVDPFFLAVGRWRNDQERVRLETVTVHPKVYELLGPQGSSRVVENESIVRRAAADPLSGFVSMREYVAGDDPRMIHWPTTARTGTLMVREHVEVRRPEFTIVVDAGAAVGTEDDFEEIVDVAATLAVHALRTGLDVVVRTTNPDHAGRPSPLAHEAEVLDLLTPVRQVESDAHARGCAVRQRLRPHLGPDGHRPRRADDPGVVERSDDHDPRRRRRTSRWWHRRGRQGRTRVRPTVAGVELIG